MTIAEHANQQQQQGMGTTKKGESALRFFSGSGKASEEDMGRYEIPPSARQPQRGQPGARSQQRVSGGSPYGSARMKFTAGLSLLVLFICSHAIDASLPCFFPGWWARVHRCEHERGHRWEARSPPPRPPRYDVAVATVLDDFLSPNMRRRTVSNKRKYAEYWGYALVAPGVGDVRKFAAGFPPAWAKLAVVREQLLLHDYVFLLVCTRATQRQCNPCLWLTSSEAEPGR